MTELLTALLVIITAAYAYFTYEMLRASRRTVETMQLQIQETVRPYVSFDLVPYGPLIEIHVKNSGTTPAHDVLANISPPVHTTIRSDKQASRLSGSLIAFLAPGRELRELLGSWREVEAMSETMKFTVSLSYLDSAKKKYHEDYVIDLGGLGKMPYVGRPDIGEELKKISESLRVIERK